MGLGVRSSHYAVNLRPLGACPRTFLKGRRSRSTGPSRPIRTSRAAGQRQERRLRAARRSFGAVVRANVAAASRPTEELLMRTCLAFRAVYTLSLLDALPT